MSRRPPVSALAVGAGLVAGAALLGIEAVLTSRRSYFHGEDAPTVGGAYGDNSDSRDDTATLPLLLMGDSTAAGVGATGTEETIGGQLAAALATETQRRVTLGSVADSGARSADLSAQARSALDAHPAVVVVLVGANDATHRTSLRVVRRATATAVGILRARNIEVIVATCPDLGAARNFAQPLRTVVSWQGRRIARAQSVAVTAAGGVVVPLAMLTGPAFRADPAHLSADLFHPSDRGYRLWADVLLPSVLGAVPPST